MSTFQNYIKATKLADSIKEIPGHECQVIAGSNDGYFIEAFGLSYRFASIECPKMIAKLFVDIVAVGPVSNMSEDTSISHEIKQLANRTGWSIEFENGFYTACTPLGWIAGNNRTELESEFKILRDKRAQSLIDSAIERSVVRL